MSFCRLGIRCSPQPVTNVSPPGKICFFLFDSFSVRLLCVSVTSATQPVATEQRQAHFRSISPAHPQSQSSAPQTGLGILMNGGVSSSAPQPVPAAPLLAPNPTILQHQPSAHAPAVGVVTTPSPLPPPPPAHNPYTQINGDQQNRIQDDLADRERQASALAAAGMVAESVNLTRPAVIGQVLQAPPPLVGIAPPVAAAPPVNPGGEIPMDGVNWNMMELGPSGVDDMDMDFAAMFDPEHEEAMVMTANGAAPATWAPAPGGMPAAPAPAAPPDPAIRTEEHGTPNPLNATSV